MSRWHEFDISDVALEFGTDTTRGRSADIGEKRRTGGNNVFLLPSADSGSIMKHMLSDASFMLLVVAYVLAAFLGHARESVVGITITAAAFLAGFLIKYSSSKRISNSYSRLLPVSKVIQDGRVYRLSVFDVEVGDLISFSKGDIVPADARIVSAETLAVAERHYDQDTGKAEYRRIEKIITAISPDKARSDACSFENMVYAGSMIISGRGTGIVTAIGNDTVISRVNSGIKLVSSDDAPDYLRAFFGFSKIVSLMLFSAVVPITIISVLLRTLAVSESEQLDLLYLFLTILSLSVTCMSEVAVAPAELLVTNELLSSARSSKAIRDRDSRITKLSAAETLADTDTLLILHPDVLIDTRNTVRRVFFADKQYRFDSLHSDELGDFYSRIAPLFRYSRAEAVSRDYKAVRAFLRDNCTALSDISLKDRPRIKNGYPCNGARACVFDADEKGSPSKYIAVSSEISILDKCKLIRTEGDCLWQTDPACMQNAVERYTDYIDHGLRPYFFVSSDQNGSQIFEGMIALGIEYPFSDGALGEELAMSGIHPVLVLRNESKACANIARYSGLTVNMQDVVLASDCKRNGLSIKDAPLSTKVYMGFDDSDIAELVERLLKNGRRILPIIKDSADRRAASPLKEYATSDSSYDSVRISSSLALRAAESETHEGGLYDALKMVRGSSTARLKLGIYKNYLAFSMLLRIVAVCFPLISGKTDLLMSTVMILLTGFLGDAAALFSIMTAHGIPVSPTSAATEASKLFSSSLFVSFGIAGAVSSAAVLITANALISVGRLIPNAGALFIAFGAAFAQIAALGACISMLSKSSIEMRFNWAYLLSVALTLGTAAICVYLPEGATAALGLIKLDPGVLPMLLIPACAGAASVLLISRLLTSFSAPRHK